MPDLGFFIYSCIYLYLFLSSVTSVWMFPEISKFIQCFYFLLRIYEEYIGNARIYGTYRDAYSRMVQFCHHYFPCLTPCCPLSLFLINLSNVEVNSSVWRGNQSSELFCSSNSCLCFSTKVTLNIIQCHNFVSHLLFGSQWCFGKLLI